MEDLLLASGLEARGGTDGRTTRLVFRLAQDGGRRRSGKSVFGAMVGKKLREGAV